MKKSRINLFFKIRRLLSGAFLSRRRRSPRSFYAQPVEQFGLSFRNPLGLTGLDPTGENGRPFADFGCGFLISGPFHTEDGKRQILHAASQFQFCNEQTRIAALLSHNSTDTQDDIIMNEYRVPFSLLYDFVDFFIVEMFSPQLDSIEEVLEELLSLRLCYEHFRPILLKIPAKTPPDELGDILSYSMLSGIDGIVAEGAERVRRIKDQVKDRMSVIAIAPVMTPESAVELLEAGAGLLIMDGGSRSRRRAARRILKTLKNKASQA